MSDFHTDADGRIVCGDTLVVNRTQHDTPADAVDIGRSKQGGELRHICNGTPGTHFGNPHRLDDIQAECDVSRSRARTISIQRFEADLKALLKQPDSTWRTAVEQLHSKTLVCWCAPKDCHGRILAEWADRLNSW